MALIDCVGLDGWEVRIAIFELQNSYVDRYVQSTTRNYSWFCQEMRGESRAEKCVSRSLWRLFRMN